ncbi:MAG: hypothetical protein PHI34_03290 [Acidobacteriota bacterium]|nr:hypothetical protein [Acidobacteriota bacterium]
MRLRRPASLLGIAVLLLLTATCTRTDLDIESPTGPSTQSLTFTLEAHPNVLLATSEQPASVIKGIVRRNGDPVANLPVYFTVLSGPGEFDDYTTRIMAMTDTTGTARVTYLGPSEDEMSGDKTAIIKGQPETSSPDYLYKTIEVRILKGN